MPTPDLPLVALLRAPGGEPWESPTARIVDVETSRCLPRQVDPRILLEAIADGRPLVATSPRAARWLAELPRSVPRTAVHCSGSRTARILDSGGWRAIAPFEGSGGDSVARRLLAERGAAAWSPPLYVCGKATAGTFEDALRGRDLSFTTLVVYELASRRDPEPGELDLLGRCDAVAVMAPSCLGFLDHVPSAIRSRLRDSIPTLAGPTTARALREAGWRDVRVAAEPRPDLLLPLLQTAPSPEGPP